MAKSRKTLKQKQLADLHSQHSQASDVPNVSPISYSLPTTNAPVRLTNQTKSMSSLIDPMVVTHDLRKTLLLTGAIVLAELVLFFVM